MKIHQQVKQDISIPPIQGMLNDAQIAYYDLEYEASAIYSAAVVEGMLARIVNSYTLGGQVIIGKKRRKIDDLTFGQLIGFLKSLKHLGRIVNFENLDDLNKIRIRLLHRLLGNITSEHAKKALNTAQELYQLYTKLGLS